MLYITHNEHMILVDAYDFLVDYVALVVRGIALFLNNTTHASYSAQVLTALMRMESKAYDSLLF